MDIQIVTTYCEIIGLPLPDLIRGGRPIWNPPLSEPDQITADLFIAALDKPATDPAVVALRDHLGAASQEWLDLVAYRKELVEVARGERYEGRVLGLVIDFLFSVCSVVDISGNNCLVIDMTAMNKIKALRDAIESDVPY